MRKLATGAAAAALMASAGAGASPSHSHLPSSVPSSVPSHAHAPASAFNITGFVDGMVADIPSLKEPGYPVHLRHVFDPEIMSRVIPAAAQHLYTAADKAYSAGAESLRSAYSQLPVAADRAYTASQQAAAKAYSVASTTADRAYTASQQAALDAYTAAAEALLRAYGELPTAEGVYSALPTPENLAGHIYGAGAKALNHAGKVYSELPPVENVVAGAVSHAHGAGAKALNHVSSVFHAGAALLDATVPAARSNHSAAIAEKERKLNKEIDEEMRKFEAARQAAEGTAGRGGKRNNTRRKCIRGRRHRKTVRNQKKRW